MLFFTYFINLYFFIVIFLSSFRISKIATHFVFMCVFMCVVFVNLSFYSFIYYIRRLYRKKRVTTAMFIFNIFFMSLNSFIYILLINNFSSLKFFFFVSLDGRIHLKATFKFVLLVIVLC